MTDLNTRTVALSGKLGIRDVAGLLARLQAAMAEPAPVIEPPKLDIAPSTVEPAPAPAIEPPAPPPPEPPAPVAPSTPDDGLLELEAEMAKLLGRPGDGGKA